MMPAIDSLEPLCLKGLDAELLKATRRRIEAAVLDKAAVLYTPNAGPSGVERGLTISMAGNAISE